MLNPKPILCANCKSQISTWDGKSTINKTIRCTSCGKYNLYRIDKDKSEIIDKPQRKCGSGITFY